VKLKLPPYLKLLIKLAFMVAALWYVFSRLDIREVLDAMARANIPFLVAALFVLVLSKLVSAIRLNRYLGSIGILISETEHMKLYLLCMYYNLFLPGGIGGDGYKIYLLNKRYQVKLKRIFWAVMVDRVNGVVALFCIAVVLFCFMPEMGAYASFAWVLVPLAIIVSFLAIRHFFRYLLPVFWSTYFLSLLVQALQVLAALFILLALKGSGNTVSYLFVFLISSLVAVLPITIGGIGSREFTFMLGAQWLGLDPALSIALSLLFYLLNAFMSFWGIVYSLGPGLELKEGRRWLRP
jgi:uncharacterized membrane protein YbhN (UPF0104 family)